jgi:hypothetical protein
MRSYQTLRMTDGNRAGAARLLGLEAKYLPAADKVVTVPLQ